MHLFPCFYLEWFLEQVVVVHELEILQEEGVRLSNATCAVCHRSKEHLSLQVGHHEHLQVLGLYVADCLVCAEDVLPLDLQDEFLEAFQCACKVRLCAILVVIVADDCDFKHVEDLLDAHCIPIDHFQLLAFIFTRGGQLSHASSWIFCFNHFLLFSFGFLFVIDKIILGTPYQNGPKLISCLENTNTEESHVVINVCF